MVGKGGKTMGVQRQHYYFHVMKKHKLCNKVRFANEKAALFTLSNIIKTSQRKKNQSVRICAIADVGT